MADQTPHSLAPPRTIHDIFPPVKRSHILNCAFHSWHARYRTITPKARTIPLSEPFIDYLLQDVIILPPSTETDPAVDSSDCDSGVFSLGSEDEGDEGEGGGGSDDDDDEDEDGNGDPSAAFPEIHAAVARIIEKLGGKVTPKLTWSAPKDAGWINGGNGLACTCPNDVYLLLKSSDFTSHDLEHAFDGCCDDGSGENVDDDDDDDDDEDEDESKEEQKQKQEKEKEKEGGEDSGDDDNDDETKKEQQNFQHHLVLRKWFPINPSVEFRVFILNRRIKAISQREPKHYPFLTPMRSEILSMITAFHTLHIKHTFPDKNYVMDVYLPGSWKKVWLIDINPFAPSTDPGLFSWMEILGMGSVDDDDSEDEDEDDGEDEDEDEERGREWGRAEVRLVESGDPETFSILMPVGACSDAGKLVGTHEGFSEQWMEVLDGIH